MVEAAEWPTAAQASPGALVCQSPPQGRGEWEQTMKTFGVQADVDAVSRRRRISPSVLARPQWVGNGTEDIKGEQQRAGREWELSMQVFGVEADIDAICRRRRIQAPCPPPTRAEIGRRATTHGDIGDVLHRGRCAAPGSSSAQAAQLVHGYAEAPTPATTQLSPRRSGEILPTGSETYDLPANGQRNRHYFDQTVKAKYYAELIGRSPSPGDHSPDRSSQGAGDRGLPLAFRRVLSATLPTSLDHDFSRLAAEQIKATVEAKVRRRYCRSSKEPRRRNGTHETGRCDLEQLVWPQTHLQQQGPSRPAPNSAPQQPHPVCGGGGRLRADFAAEVASVPLDIARPEEHSASARLEPGQTPLGLQGWDPSSSDSGAWGGAEGAEDHFFHSLVEIPEERPEDADSFSPRDGQGMGSIMGLEEQHALLQEQASAAARKVAPQAARETEAAQQAAARECLPTLLGSRQVSSICCQRTL